MGVIGVITMVSCIVLTDGYQTPTLTTSAPPHPLYPASGPSNKHSNQSPTLLWSSPSTSTNIHTPNHTPQTSHISPVFGYIWNRAKEVRGMLMVHN